MPRQQMGLREGSTQETLSKHHVHVSEGRLSSQQPQNGSLSSAPSSSLNGSVIDFKMSVPVSECAVALLLLTKLLFWPEWCTYAAEPENCNQQTHSIMILIFV